MGVASYIVIFVVVAFAALVLIGRHRVARRRAAGARAFDEAFGQLDQRPQLEMGSSYGFTTFKVTFRTRADKESAAVRGQCATFLRAIGIAFSDEGSADRPFDASRAVYFTYEGYAPNQMIENSSDA